MVAQAPGDARTVVNVGAGAGSYEPADRTVLAVEPSSTMVAQRPVGAAPSSGRRQSPCRCPTDVPRRPWPCSPSTTGATRPPVSPSSSPSRGAGVLTWEHQRPTPSFWLISDHLPETAGNETGLACGKP